MQIDPCPDVREAAFGKVQLVSLMLDKFLKLYLWYYCNLLD